MKGYPLLRQLCLTLSVCPLKSCFTVTVGCSVICTLGEFGSLPLCIFSGTVFSLSFSLSISEQPIWEQILLKTYYYQIKDYTARWDREMSMKTFCNICLVMLRSWEWSLAQYSETPLNGEAALQWFLPIAARNVTILRGCTDKCALSKNWFVEDGLPLWGIQISAGKGNILYERKMLIWTSVVPFS